MALTTDVWTGRGFSPKPGVLSLEATRLRFELDGKTVFDAPVAQLGITWPWYGFGCQFWAHTPAGNWFISFTRKTPLAHGGPAFAKDAPGNAPWKTRAAN